MDRSFREQGSGTQQAPKSFFASLPILSQPYQVDGGRVGGCRYLSRSPERRVNIDQPCEYLIQIANSGRD